MKSGNSNKAPLIITLAFLLAGVVMLIIGFFNEIVSWLWKYGLVVIAVSLPIAIMIIHKIISKKIKDL